MPENLYYVQPGDTLFRIAAKFGVTVQGLLAANVICNPNLIFVGQPLIIPRPGLDLPKAGGDPYYVVLPGDTLYCLARQFNTTVPVLASVNGIANPNVIFSGTELLIASEIPNPAEINERWVTTAEQYCDTLNSLQIHGIYYIGTFQWAAAGRAAVPYLLNLLKNPCDTVRYYAVLALGRLALNREVKNALAAMQNDTAEITGLATLAIQRINLASRGQKRTHFTIADTYLAEQPYLDAPAVALPKGTTVFGLRWHIPSPTGEEMPPGGLAMWDRVQVVNTGQIGYLLRVGYQEIELM